MNRQPLLPGQYFDAESGLHYNYFRDYDPKTGRYIEPDPIGVRGLISASGIFDSRTGLFSETDPIFFVREQPNLYAYAGNNSLNGTDPAGLSVVVPVPPGVDPEEFKESIETSLTCPGMVSGPSNLAGKTVREILKGKKGSILQAPLKPGTPGWDEIMDKTISQLEKMARDNPGVKTIIKLLKDSRFNR